MFELIGILICVSVAAAMLSGLMNLFNENRQNAAIRKARAKNAQYLTSRRAKPQRS